jgi:hypothetical protein
MLLGMAVEPSLRAGPHRQLGAHSDRAAISSPLKLRKWARRQQRRQESE